MACMSCKRFFHLSCLGDGFEVTRFCHQCLENDSGAEETSESDEPFIPLKLREAVKIRGLKIVHQNTQSHTKSTSFAFCYMDFTQAYN